MKVRSLVLYLMVFAGLASATRGAIERAVEKDFTLPAGGVFKIDTCQGVIRIERSPDNLIHLLVRQTIAADSGEDADRRLRDLDLQFETGETEIVVKARYLRAVRWAWESWPPVALAYVVKVPATCNLDLVTPEGDITVCSLEGRVQALTANGAIFIGEINGSVRATSLRGDVSVTACTGELTLTAKAGNVLVGRAGGLTKIEGSGGAIDIQRTQGNLKVEGDNSDVRISFVYPLIESSELNAAGGDIEVVFDQRCACTLSASSSLFGAVKVRNLPLAIESGKVGSSKVRATLNHGGPKMTISASGGNVRLIGSEP